MNLFLAPETLMQPEALYSAKKLLLLGHTLNTDTAQLSDTLKNILTSENIVFTASATHDAQLHFDASSGETPFRLEFKEQSLAFKHWADVRLYFEYPSRFVEHVRTTKETDIRIKLNLFGSGKSTISTGIGFFDHMLDQIAKHALLDLDLSCKGDLHIDEHHTIEDVGIALGEALSAAIGDKKGLERFGFVLPMDEAQATIALDLSGRPYLVFKCEFKREYVGELPTEMVEHFFYSLAMNLKATLQIQCEGTNDHHKVEACFKGFSRALRQALVRHERNAGIIPSSKGSL